MKATNNSKTILVTGAGGSAGYNFIHSLKMANQKYITIGVDIDKNHLALSNADIKYLVPPNKRVTDYLQALNHIILKHHIDLVHPQPDPEVAFIAKHKTQLKTKTFLPKIKTITTCHDKFAALKDFQAAKVPVAKSFVLNSKDNLINAFNILKRQGHTKMWIRAIKGAGSKAALPIGEWEQGEFWIKYWAKNKNIGYGSFMLSEFLPGKEYAFQSVWQNGQLIVSQARERQEYIFGNLTPSGQSSSPSVAVTVSNEAVNQIATNAVLAIDPSATGIFCVDLKENIEGTPSVIEINPGRFFTTSNFFAAAGCNMPDLYVSLALGLPLPQVKQYNNLKPGLHWLRIIDMGFKLVDTNWGIDGDLTRDLNHQT